MPKLLGRDPQRPKDNANFVMLNIVWNTSRNARKEQEIHNQQMVLEGSSGFAWKGQ